MPKNIKKKEKKNKEDKLIHICKVDKQGGQKIGLQKFGDGECDYAQENKKFINFEDIYLIQNL